jgi:hypothetical protein
VKKITKEILLALAANEDDEELSLFLCRLANGKPTVVAVVADGLLQELAGLPGDYHIADYDTQDDHVLLRTAAVIGAPPMMLINTDPSETLDFAVEAFTKGLEQNGSHQ